MGIVDNPLYTPHVIRCTLSEAIEYQKILDQQATNLLVSNKWIEVDKYGTPTGKEYYISGNSYVSSIKEK